MKPARPGGGQAVRVRGVLRKVLVFFFVALLLGVVAAIVTAPSRLVNNAKTPELHGKLDEWMSRSEGAVRRGTPIIPEAEKRIRWFAGRTDSKTRLALVYLHGFSATRQEIAPVGELIAEGLKANLFETRLSGHGLRHNPLAGIRAEDWLEDAAEALAIGAAIGDEVIVMGTSTGATLALAMKDHEAFRQVSAVILLSPNFAPSDSSAELLTWPGGPLLARLLVGGTRSWAPHNELQKRYWSTTYPMEALIEMMRLVDYVRGKLPLQLEQPLLTIYSPADAVIDTGLVTAAFEAADSPRKQLIEIPGSGDPSNHVLAGDILSPQNNQLLADYIIQFVSLTRP